MAVVRYLVALRSNHQRSAVWDNLWASKRMQQIKGDDTYLERLSHKEQILVLGIASLIGKRKWQQEGKAVQKSGFLKCILAAVCTALNFLLKFCCCDQVLIS